MTDRGRRLQQAPARTRTSWHLGVDSAEPGRQAVVRAEQRVTLIAKSMMALRRSLPKERVLTNPGFTVTTKEIKH